MNRHFHRLDFRRRPATGLRLAGGGAGIFCGLASVAMVGLLVWGGWSAAEEHTIVLIFGGALGGFIACMAAVMIGLLVGGPVGRFKGSATRDGVSLEAEGE